MKRKTQDKAAIEKQVNRLCFVWKLAALFIPLIVVALMLVSAHFINTKMISKQHGASGAYEARDFALFVAMPLLNATLK